MFEITDSLVDYFWPHGQGGFSKSSKYLGERFEA